MSRVLVTGGSGFIGSHAVLQLVEAGYEVRTTVRSLEKEDRVRSMLARGGVTPAADLSFVEADLESDEGWAAAVEGCDHVLHVASPFPPKAPKHEDELIVPARDGALRVLRASRDAGVKRVVLTSSFAAVGYGHGEGVFDESSWTNLDGPAVGAYVKSKTLAERAAWDFVASGDGAPELAVVNPVAVFGPILGPDYSTSIHLVRRLMDGDMPGCPKLWFGVVDVRDVADLHLRAMTDPVAKGERFLAVSGEAMSIAQMSETLRARLGDAAARAPTLELPNWVVRLVGLFDAEVRGVTPELGTRKNATNAKARGMLGWNPRSPEDALVAAAESLLELGIVDRP